MSVVGGREGKGRERDRRGQAGVHARQGLCPPPPRLFPPGPAASCPVLLDLPLWPFPSSGQRSSWKGWPGGVLEEAPCKMELHSRDLESFASTPQTPSSEEPSRVAGGSKP